MHESHPADVPHILHRSLAPTAYTPPWMIRNISKKNVLPPSNPPDI